MTASVTKTQLNNMEEMFSAVKKSAEKVDYAVDKTSKDFNKVLDKSIEKINNNDAVKSFKKVVGNNEVAKNEVTTDEVTTDEVSADELSTDGVTKNYKVIDEKVTLKDVSNETLNSAIEIDKWLEFKGILTEITEEANTETSLNLTLSKDINELITQLQEATQSVEENVEEIEIEQIAELILPTDVEQKIDLEAETEVKMDTEVEVSTSDVNVPFEQIITFYDKSTNLDLNNETQQNSEQENSSLIEMDSFEQSEIIEFAESLVEEVAVDKSTEKTVSSDAELPLDEEMLKDLKIESLEAQADTTGGETLMQRQAPEEVAVKAIISREIEAFDVKLEATQNTQSTQQVQSKPVEINPSRILEQISKQLEGLQSGSKVNIVLNPESLGKVNIQLFSTKEGLMAQLIVTTQEAKDILMKGLDGLKDTLLAQGVSVDNVSVKVADAQKSEYEQDWTEQEGSRGGNKGQKNPDREEKEKGLFEQMMAQTLENENGNV